MIGLFLLKIIFDLTISEIAEFDLRSNKSRLNAPLSAIEQAQGGIKRDLFSAYGAQLPGRIGMV